MPPSPEGSHAAALAAALRTLPLTIDAVGVRVDEIPLGSYPGGRRPTSTVQLAAGTKVGSGEHVGWTTAAHRAFARSAGSLGSARSRTTVGAFSDELRALSDPYERAALEAAAIDLALAQAETSLAGLIGARPRPCRYVLSFTPHGDPAEEIRSQIADGPPLDVKIDVEPAWPAETFAALASTGRVVVLDWKRRGVPARHEAAHRMIPDALLEDPGADPLDPCPAIESRWSVDASFTHRLALEQASGRRPVAANLKPARMGGVLEALDGAAWCAAHGVRIYFGGMFEVGPGRRQLRDLAGLLCPDAPNDVAPLTPETRPRGRATRLATPTVAGFGRPDDGDPNRV